LDVISIDLGDDEQLKPSSLANRWPGKGEWRRGHGRQPAGGGAAATDRKKGPSKGAKNLRLFLRPPRGLSATHLRLIYKLINYIFALARDKTKLSDDINLCLIVDSMAFNFRNLHRGTSTIKITRFPPTK
jgi:hypothetical protein